jgi:uncharacterized membrane protein (UPF0182 family)
MQETLEQALTRVAPGGLGPRAAATAAVQAAPARAQPEAAAGEPLAQQARAHYERALQAQREGDWALYGEEIRRLGEVLERMNRAR